ncbi:MAG: hypothetical protein PUD59_00215 [bacterium]|nr:hypothetical protein [bacterium]
MKEITKKEIKNISTLNLSNNISNTQGKLLIVKYNKQIYVEKQIFFIDEQIYYENIKTLKNLYNFKEILPNNFCIPEYLISDKNRYVGFLLPYLKGKNLTEIIYNDSYSIHEQINYLQQIGILLEKLKNIREEQKIQFFINDLHESNIIINDGNINVIDLDTCLINSNYAYKSRYLNSAGLLRFTKDKYKINKSMSPGFFIADEQSDLYCYNMIILNYLYGKDNKLLNVNYFDLYKYNDFINYLYKIGISNDLINAFDRLSSYDENINPYNYLKTLSEDQLKQARQYNKIRNPFNF